MKLKFWLSAGLVGTLAVVPYTASADESSSSESSLTGLGRYGLTVGGFIRSETAFSTANDKRNPFNQNGNPFNGVATARDGIFEDTTTRNGITQSQVINLQMVRAELETKLRISDKFSAVTRVRGIFDPAWYSEYDPAKVNAQAGADLRGRPNYFKYDVEGNENPQPGEWTGRRYQIGFAAAVLQYNDGPLTIRAGIQQIAWGEAIFFRVLDLPNGLDFRRHSLLDFAAEEFSDKRVAAPAIRTTYSFESGWMADAYVQKFQPSVYSNRNTPYNVIASQFTVHDRYSAVDKKLDAGMRVKGAIGDFNVQAAYTHRYNPDGVFRWTQSNVNRDVPGLVGSGAALAGTPLEVDNAGIWSADEWFYYAGQTRLNGVAAFNALVNDFQPFTGLLGAMEAPDYDATHQQLDTFFQLAGGALLGQNEGGLRGHIERKYRREDNIGLGGSYVFAGDPGSFLEQMIINVEALYTPNRTFTDPSLRKEFLKKKEWTTAVVVEKYQRFSADFPATYFVAQALYKSHSDLLGRYLGGMGGDTDREAPGFGGGYKAVALAMQQPFPNLIWRADLAVLYDLKGGALVQPAVRWKPRGEFTVDVFYNYLNGHMGNRNENIVGSVDYADELGVRLGYQF